MLVLLEIVVIVVELILGIMLYNTNTYLEANLKGMRGLIAKLVEEDNKLRQDVESLLKEKGDKDG